MVDTSLRAAPPVVKTVPVVGSSLWEGVALVVEVVVVEVAMLALHTMVTPVKNYTMLFYSTEI